jgi:prevent-host-death family protein
MWYLIKTGGAVMNISSDIKPVSFLKSHAADILKQINETHRPIVITQNGEPRGVLLDPESYDNMRKAIGLLKLISQGEEDIKKGNTRSQDRVLRNIEKMLAKKEK